MLTTAIIITALTFGIHLSTPDDMEFGGGATVAVVAWLIMDCLVSMTFLLVVF